MSHKPLSINVGSIVRHKLGGPKMVVHGIWTSSTYEQTTYSCQWWDDFDRKFRSADFGRGELVRLA